MTSRFSISMCLMAVAGVLSGCSSGAAQEPAGEVSSAVNTVDTGALVPALNPSVTYHCVQTGAGPQCSFNNILATDGWEVDWDFTCGDKTVYHNLQGWNSGVRYYNIDNLMYKRTFVPETFTEVIGLAPDGSGPHVTFSVHSTETQTFPVPGDTDQMNDAITGMTGQFKNDAGQTIFITGEHTVFVGDEQVKGVGDYLGAKQAADWDTLISTVCSALGAP